MTLTDRQQQLVEENMGLVHAVLKRCVSGPHSLGVYSYDDLFQIGCIGLCKAAAEYTPGRAAFSTYAFILIRNEVFHALEYASLRQNTEVELDVVHMPAAVEEDALCAEELKSALCEAKRKLTGVTAKGVDAMLMMSEGKTCREIGMLFGTTDNNVSAWISKARKALAADADFMQVALGSAA